MWWFERTVLAGGVYVQQGRYDKAKPLFVKRLEISRRVLGEEHKDTRQFMDCLTFVYSKQGRIFKAWGQRGEAEKLRKKLCREEKQRKKTQKSDDQAGISTSGKLSGEEGTEE